MQQSKIVYTLGTSNRLSETFFSLLDSQGIRAIADVRRFPKSKRFPHFDRGELESSAERMHITYSWMGNLLGGFREESYEVYRKNPAYLDGLEQLERLALSLPTAVVCAERLPWKCHRFQIAQDLEEREWQIIHIIDRGNFWRPGNGRRS